MIPNAVNMAHCFVARVLSKGDTAVDATAGNGHDTLFLAEKVGPTGFVYSFDIQEQALAATKNRLDKSNYAARVRLINDGHENMMNYLNKPVQAFMFNLGFLPGSSKEVITRPDTTLPAIRTSLQLLEGNGIITIAVYSKHKGGLEEKEAIENQLLSLDEGEYTVAKYFFLNHHKYAPYLLAVTKNI